MKCLLRLELSQECTLKGGRCNHIRAYWCQGVLKVVLTVAIMAALIYGLVLFACWRADAYAWAQKPIVVGPVDWPAKNADCIRRAILIDGFVDYVEDDKYCIVRRSENAKP